MLRIRRQDRPDSPARWEEFAVPYRPNMNVIACLQHIAANAVTADGRQTTPVVYESGCLEEVCGACTMLINGRTRQACSALVG
jgi:succinate dehydrogenase / fumarate reductase iron-sulfur subunit